MHIYVLKVIERLIQNDAWTDDDNQIVSEHFQKLVELKDEGILVMAGRTTHEGPSSFGIVVLNADYETSHDLMLNDPAVKKGIMTAELYPYHLALFDENYIKKG